jgi:hypothetical protein
MAARKRKATKADQLNGSCPRRKIARRPKAAEPSATAPMPAVRPKSNPGEFRITKRDDETRAQGAAHAVLKPALRAAFTVSCFTSTSMGAVDLNTLLADLTVHIEKLNDGDLHQGEAMLLSHAHSLDAIFNALAHRGALNIGEHLEAADLYLRLALRAQSQARATIETLGLLKNPKTVAFVRQANIAHGHQQVNNRRSSRARGKKQNPPSKLLEVQDGKRLDPTTTGSAVGGDLAMEAVGAIHRSADTGG